MSKVSAVICFCIVLPALVFGQANDPNDSVTYIKTKKNLKFQYTQLIVPASLMTYGIIGLESHELLLFNDEIKEDVKEDIDEKITIDDFTQYVPAVSVYALNGVGVKGKNNLKDRSIILGVSYLIMGSTVAALKHTVPVTRPDGSANNSFPSGHTAAAFAGAEFLWQEYKDVSIWYGITGYAIATGTGFFRIYNDKHWLTDVAMGAGIGIISAKIAYWIYPLLESKLSKKYTNSVTLGPFYNGKQTGLGLAISFK